MVTSQQYWAIKHALEPVEKALINYYEIQWHLKHYVPTVEEVFEHLKKTRPKLKITSVNYYLNRAAVVKALDDRGIPWRQHSREDLTPTQVAAALTVMNFADERTNSEKLEQLGINPSQYYAWLNDPQFKNMVDSLSDQNLINIRPTAIVEFTKLINKGDWKAIQYFLDTTGEMRKNSTPNTEDLLRFIIEIIQKHVKDEATIAAIAQDMKLATQNRTLETAMQPAIESYVIPASEELEEAGFNYPVANEDVEDLELEQAKKMLGVI